MGERDPATLAIAEGTGGSQRTEPDPATVVVDGSTGEELGRPSDTLTTKDVAGSTLGRFVAVEVIGRGAMGSVIRAYDPKLRREVALKRLHAHVLDDAAQARLVREAHAMAALSDPNVVSIYDVDASDDGITLVMELVPGQPLSKWLDEERAWKKIVDAFVAAGRGLAAAHNSGLIHRDFKPSNVLVAEDGRVKVTDFGLAKGMTTASSSGPQPESAEALGSSQGDSLDSALTMDDTVMGTPRYMAPEQHCGTSSPAADQYAFCVALWEALCGSPPFVGDSVLALARAKTAGPPAWAGPKTVPRRIADALNRGLQVDAAHRWQSMDDLLAELEPPSKSSWRAVAVTSMTLGVVAVGSLAWWSQTQNACQGAQQHLEGIWSSEQRQAVRSAMLGTELNYAGDAATLVTDELDTYADRWVATHTDACEATAVRQEQSQAVLDLRMACLSRARSKLESVVDLLRDADAAIVERASRLTASLPSLGRCADVQALLAGVPLPEDPQLAASVEDIRAELGRADVLLGAGRYDEGLALAQEVAKRADGVGHPPLRAEILLKLGMAEQLTTLGPRTEAKLAEAMRLAFEHGDLRTAALATSRLALLLSEDLGRPKEAVWVGDVALGLARAQNFEPGQEAMIRASLGTAMLRDGRYEDAEAMQAKAVDLVRGGAHIAPQTAAQIHSNLGLVLEKLGRPEDAEPMFRGAVAVVEERLGAKHPEAARMRANVALALYRQGRYAEAQEEIELSMATLSAAVGPTHPDTLQVKNMLASVLDNQGRSDEARAVFEEIVDALVEVRGPEHVEVAMARNNLAIALARMDRNEEAEAEFRAALEIWEAALGEDHPEVAQGISNLAGNLADQDRHREAEPLFRRALGLREARLGPDHPDVAKTQADLANTLLQLDRPDEAVELAARAMTTIENATTQPEQLATIQFALARSLRAANQDPERARKLARQAHANFESQGPPYADAAQTVQDWLNEK